MSSYEPTEAEDSRREKSVLFCPACGHESRVAGDWQVRERDGTAVYECPDCGATVAVRGGYADTRGGRPGAGAPADD